MLFPNLEIEAEVQENDRTRLKANKSFVSTGSDPITTVLIQAGSTETPIECFNSDQTLWYLDYEFTSSADISSLNNKLDFSEDNGTTELTATITSANYTLAALAIEIQTQLNATGSFTYTVSINLKNQIVISSNGNFLPVLNGSNKSASLWGYIGFNKSFNQGTSITGDIVESLPIAITLTVGDGVSTTSETRLLQVYTKEGDRLFSSDSDLTRHETKILEWVEDGRNTFLNEHRRAQHLILAYLDRNGYVDIYRNKFTKFSVIDLEEVHEWSVFLTLKLIFDSIYNSVDDVFHKKAREYEILETYYRDRVILRLDVDGNGETDFNEGIGIAFATVVRR